MRMKKNASSLSMVPMVTPRDRCERNLTHSKNFCGSRSSRRLFRCACSSSQVSFWVSQTSVVSEPRTARAFSRAACRQQKIDEGLPGSRTRKSSTRSCVTRS